MIRPLLAATITDIYSLHYPLLASPKLDGIRCLLYDGRGWSRNGKLIPNHFVQLCLAELSSSLPLDGELIVDSLTAKDCFRATTKGVMTTEGRPFFTYNVFDSISENPFNQRFSKAREAVNSLMKKWGRLCYLPSWLPTIVHHETVWSPTDLLSTEEKFLQKGYEGVILRDPNGRYKEGRSTLKEGILLKLKRFKDSEAIVIDVIEKLHNANEKKYDPFGHAERSTSKEGMIPADTMGALVVRDVVTQVEFEIGTGFDDAERAACWVNPKALHGRILKYKFFAYGQKDKPRFPVFLGWRKD